MLTRMVRAQLAIFTVAGVVAMLVMAFGYAQIQSYVGLGRITVTLELPDAGGMYRFGNVTYRGVQVGTVTKVGLTPTGVRATLSLASSPKIPSDLRAQVRSVSAVGEQYVDLQPRIDAAPYLVNGSVITVDAAALPQPVGPLLDKLDALLRSVPGDRIADLLRELSRGFDDADYDLQSLLDSGSTITGALGPEADHVRRLVEDVGPLLHSQDQSADAIRIWARSLAGVTDQLVTDDAAVRTILQTGPGSAQETTKLFEQLKPTLPILLGNLQSVGPLLVTYRPGLEQLLVLLPPLVANVQSALPNRNPSGLPMGNFAFSISDPPACTVGFLPPSQWRSPADTSDIDTPDDLYCKLPQDSPIDVRGLRNVPCMTKPGKRAPTAAICNSDQNYEPIADKQPVLGPYPRDPSQEAQGIAPDTRWFPDQGLYAPPGQGPAVPPGTPPPAPTPAMDLPPLSPMGPPVDPGYSGQVPPVSAGIPPAPVAPVVPVAPSDTPPAAAGASNHDLAAAREPEVEYVQYDPRNGEYVTADGAVHRRTDLVAPGIHSWQDLVYRP